MFSILSLSPLASSSMPFPNTQIQQIKQNTIQYNAL